MKSLKVIKKDGSIIDFNIKNVIGACKTAGFSNERAEEVASKVVNEIHKVKSSRIRELILTYVKNINPKYAKQIIQYDIRNQKEQEPKRHQFMV
jgi:transcriptional regulator NrdR family protein